MLNTSISKYLYKILVLKCVFNNQNVCENVKFIQCSPFIEQV